MERVYKIWAHPIYQEQFTHLQEAERDRIFCNHTLSHFLDVARLMYLYALTEQVDLEKHLIYAAALLHDIGRFEEITKGTPHEQASVALATKILPECGYTKSETSAVCAAILGHRSMPNVETLPRKEEAHDQCEIIAAIEEGMNGSSTQRAKSFPGESLLSVYLRRADKESRCCFCCPAVAKCHWPDANKNFQITL